MLLLRAWWWCVVLMACCVSNGSSGRIARAKGSIEESALPLRILSMCTGTLVQLAKTVIKGVRARALLLNHSFAFLCRLLRL